MSVSRMDLHGNYFALWNVAENKIRVHVFEGKRDVKSKTKDLSTDPRKQAHAIAMMIVHKDKKDKNASVGTSSLKTTRKVSELTEERLEVKSSEKSSSVTEGTEDEDYLQKLKIEPKLSSVEDDKPAVVDLREFFQKKRSPESYKSMFLDEVDDSSSSSYEIEECFSPKSVSESDDENDTSSSEHKLSLDDKLEKIIKKTAKAKISGSESDDAFTEPKLLSTPPVLNKDGVSFVDMTVRCSDINIKGSTLIELVHQKVREYYNHYSSSEIPEIKSANGNHILVLQKSSDWFTTLGGWKGMMPGEEIKQCKFLPEKKFDGVQIYNNGTTFQSNGIRIFIGNFFEINNFDITRNWDKHGREVQRKRDLSYSQIVRALKKVREGYGFNDKQIAELQLAFLSGKRMKNRTTTNRKLQIFLDFLNGLMFGVEPSGLNAGLVTSLMTLDLIKDGKFTYEEAFKGNDFGGIYPFATHNKEGNSDTYINREKVLGNGDIQKSMKKYRDTPSMSPVAIKEAILIKYWLKHKGFLNQKYIHEEQVQVIKEAIDGLIKTYFFPDQKV